MATITLTPGPTEVRVSIVAADHPTATRVQLTRTMLGIRQVVRAWPVFDPTGWVHQDIDVIFNTPLSYEARLYDDSGTLLATIYAPGQVTVSHDQALIRDSILPQIKANLRMAGKASGDTETDVSREVLRPRGRSNPVVITDVRQAPSGKSQCLTLTRGEARSLEGLLATGNVVQFTGPVGFDITWPRYLSIGRVTNERVSEALDEARLWTFEWLAVDAPIPFEPPRATTWQQLKDAQTKWADITDTAWIDVLYPITPVPTRVSI